MTSSANPTPDIATSTDNNAQPMAMEDVEKQPQLQLEASSSSSQSIGSPADVNMQNSHPATPSAQVNSTNTIQCLVNALHAKS